MKKMETKVRINKKERKLQKMWDVLYDPEATTPYELAKECFIWGLNYLYATQNGDVSAVMGLFGSGSKGVGKLVPKTQQNGRIQWIRPEQQKTIELAGSAFGSELKDMLKKIRHGGEEPSPIEG